MEHVEQATAAPGEIRPLRDARKVVPVLSDNWFTLELAESLGITKDEYANLRGVTIDCEAGAAVSLVLRRIAVEQRG